MEQSQHSHFFVRHWVAALAIAVLTCVVGALSYKSLPVEQYPDIAPPLVTISAAYSGADANAVMKSVIMPIEEAVNGVENMMYMIGTSTANGDAEVDIYFRQGTDPDQAAVKVQNRISQAQGMLPEEVIRNGVTVQKSVNAILTIMSLESTDGKFDQQFISNYLDINVMPRISRIPGVGRTAVMGEQYGVRVWLKPDLMGLYGVTPDEVVAAINEQNLVTPIGSLESTTAKIDFEFNGMLNDMSQFEDIIVRASEKGEMLRLRDIADVELGARAYDFRTDIDGHPGAIFTVKQAPGANATQVNAEIRKVIDEVSRRLPAGLEFKTLETSDDFLFAAMYNVKETLVIAILLVVFVVYLFLQDFRATIIPSISIIVSLVGTFVIVRLAGFSLNLLTLFALVLAIGTVVDDAIVVVEAVMAKLETGMKDMRSAVSHAMSDVSAACVSTTLVFMAVFIPVTFMSGTSGTFFRQFGITMAAAVGLSAVSALTLCPALCVLMLKPVPGRDGKKRRKNINYYVRTAYNASFDALLGKYMAAVRRFLRRPLLAAAMLVATCVMLAFMIANAQKDLVPQEDQGFLLVNVALPPSTYLTENEVVTVKLEEYIRSLDEVEVVASVKGISLMDDVTSTNYSTLMVRLKNWKDRPFFSIADIQDKINQWAAINLPQADVSAFQMPQIPGYGNGSMLSVNLQDRSGTGDKQAFVQMGDEFTQKLNARPEVEFAASSYSQDFLKYTLDVDEIACKRMGISPQTVLKTIGDYLAGRYVGSYIQYGNVYRVLIQAGKQYRMSANTLHNIFVPVGNRMVPVTEFVSISETLGSSQENHFNLFPCYPVTTMPAAGYTSRQVQQAIEEVKQEVFPDGYGYEFAGMAREQAEQADSNETPITYSICMLLIYLILACLYDSLFVPFAVLLSVPFGLLGSYLMIKPLELMGVGANIYVQTGVIMLIGLVAKTAILITEYAVQKRREGLSLFDAAAGACQDRLRPIIMTVFAMIAGMIPLILGNGAGALGNKSLALTVVGGSCSTTRCCKASSRQHWATTPTCRRHASTSSRHRTAWQPHAPTGCPRSRWEPAAR